jgi:hypothetical protein
MHSVEYMTTNTLALYRTASFVNKFQFCLSRTTLIHEFHNLKDINMHSFLKQQSNSDMQC